MNIIYCHHANRKITNPPSQDNDITTLGKKDAKLFNKLLKKSNTKISAIYSSEYLRCTKTAKILNKGFNVPILLDQRLNEKPKSEDWQNCQKRISDCLLDIIKKHDNSDTVIVVTSGVNISGFINLAYGLNPSPNAPYLQISSLSPITFIFDKEKFDN